MNTAKVPHQTTTGAIIMSTVLLGLVGFSSNEILGLFEVSIAAYLVMVACFYVLFGRGSVFFNILFGNVIAIYLCFYNFFVDSLFKDLPSWEIMIGFLLPLAAFLLGILIKRHEIHDIVTHRKPVHEADFAKAFVWLAPIAAVGVFAFSAHRHMPIAGFEDYFLLEMGAISLIVIFASRDIALMLVDTGMLFSDFFASNVRLVKPAFAFFTFYSLSIIFFATIYRIIEQLSLAENFMVRGEVRDLTFVESLYFSMVTFSTLGFGDIVPLTNSIRFIVGIQAFVSALLFLFGVHAIISHRKD